MPNLAQKVHLKTRVMHMPSVRRYVIKTGLFMLVLICITFTSISQSRSVTGTVKDSTGVPLSGLSVNENGKKNIVVTDAQGFFKITVSSPSGNITIKGIGFIERTLSARQDLGLIVLKSKTTQLDEITVMGYTAKKRAEISSSVSVVSGESLRDVTSYEITTLLQGKAPGVVVSGTSGNPATSSSVLIRGAGTINASTAPLYVVDGNIGGTFNVNDIESVTILKDAAATGLFGSRAANGVIIITTKKGKSGKTKIDFSSTVGFSEVSKGNFKLMNTQQLYDYQKTFFNPNPAVLTTNTDWWSLGFRRAIVNSYSLSASGGNEKTQYYFGGNYYKEEGTQISNDKKAYSIRANLNEQLTDKLKLSVLVNGIYTRDNNNPEATVYDSYLNLPFDSAYNSDGSPRDARFGTWYGRDRDNFLHGLQYDFSTARSLNLTGDVNLDYKISNHFTLSTYNRARYFNSRSDVFYDKRSKNGVTNGGTLSNGVSYSNTLLTSNRLRYRTNIGLHSISALVVEEIEKSYSDNINTSVKGLPPGRPVLSTATDIISNPSGGTNESLFSKYLGQVEYDYASKYFFVGSFVNEFSSRFGSNNPSANFYQLGASWIVSRESSFKLPSMINFLKARASYGTTGNADGIGNYAALGLYSISQAASYAGAPGAFPSQKANPNLTWEKMNTANLGVDLGLFQRIDLSVDIYERKSNGLLFFRPLPATVGYDGVYENVGSVRNRGIEFNLNTKNLTGKFSWETNLNMAFNQNKVLEVNQGRTEVYSGAQQPVAVGHDINDWYMPVWAGVDPANGNPLWEKLTTDADGKQYKLYTSNYNAATRQFIGKSSAPKFTGAFTNTFSYQGFSLNAFFNFVNGSYIYNGSRFLFDNDGLYESYNQMVLADGWSRWQKPGDIATHPKSLLGRSDASNASSSRYLEDGSYIRLKNIKLSYDLPRNIVAKLRIVSARFFVSGDNLWTSTKFTGPDPEVNLSGGTSSTPYPISKKILFGLNVSF